MSETPKTHSGLKQRLITAFVLIPLLLAILIMMVVPAGPMAKSAFLLAAALPAAVVVPMMVEQSGYGEKLSSDIVLWSTLISMVTMPVCVWIAGILY